MSSISGLRPRIALVTLLLLQPAAARAQGWREAWAWGVGSFGSPNVAAVGAGLAWRDRGRTRVGAAVAVGVGDWARAGGRAELIYHFLLDPALRRGTALYGGAGAAVNAAGDGRLRPFAQLVLGAEQAPGSRSGSFIEVGLGGGLRLAAGMRWRKQNAPRR
jgi:hypothetical protein